MHTCTEEDYSKFYPVDQRSSAALNRIKKEPHRSMLCLDWDNAGIDLYGTESSGIFSELDLVIMPCNAMITPYGASDDRISPECVRDLDK